MVESGVTTNGGRDHADSVADAGRNGGVTLKMKFTKMHGAGNDFIMIDDRSLNFPEADVALVRSISARDSGVGCEGVLVVRLTESSTECDYRMIFLNPDGSRASMCGNAARCVALFAFEHGIGGRHQRVGTDAGVIALDVVESGGGRGVVRVHMTPPKDRVPGVWVDLPGGRRAECFKVDTGVPHAVVFVDDVAAVDVVGDGRTIRRAAVFAPAGANVDFVQVVKGSGAVMRTYERGVEGESGACGTGAVAAGIAMAEKLGIGLPVFIRVRSGDMLAVGGETAASGLCHAMTLTGPACKVFEGVIDTELFEGGR